MASFPNRFLKILCCLMVYGISTVPQTFAAPDLLKPLGTLQDKVRFDQAWKGVTEWEGNHPSAVCKAEWVKAFPNCRKWVAKKWIDLYLKDPDNSPFYVSLTSVDQEEDIVEILKHLGNTKIPLQAMAKLKQDVAKATTAITDPILEKVEKVSGVVGEILKRLMNAWDFWAVLMLILGSAVSVGVVVVPGFLGLVILTEGLILLPAAVIGAGVLAFLAGSVGTWSALIVGEMLIKDPSPRIPIVELSRVTDKIAQTLEKDMPKLKILAINPRYNPKIMLSKPVNLKRVMLRVKSSPDTMALKNLLDNTQLQKLDLSQLEMTQAGFKNLGEAISGKVLQGLNLATTKMNAAAVQALAAGIGAQSVTIPELNLVRTLTTGDGQMGRALAQLLPKLNLSTLHLSGNPLSAEGINALAEGLSSPITLPNLGLVNTLEGGQNLGEALGKLLPKLKVETLNLSLNKLQPGAIEGIAQELGNQSLRFKTLRLMGALKGKDDAMAQALPALLAKLSVDTLDLRGNKWGKKTRKAINQALKANPQIKKASL